MMVVGWGGDKYSITTRNANQDTGVLAVFFRTVKHSSHTDTYKLYYGKILNFFFRKFLVCGMNS